MGTPMDRARKLVEGFATWLGDPVDYANPTLREQEQLTAIAAAGLALREALTTPVPGSPVDEALGLAGWRCAMASDVEAFDAAIAKAMAEGGE